MLVIFDSGRLCDDPKCRGKLKDTIINFGQNLPQGIYTSQCQVVNNTGITSSIISIHNAAVLDKSFEHAERADLCLAMGSSLTVTPAADIPEVPYVSHSLMFIIKITLMKFRRWAQEGGDWWSSTCKPLP